MTDVMFLPSLFSRTSSKAGRRDLALYDRWLFLSFSGGFSKQSFRKQSNSSPVCNMETNTGHEMKRLDRQDFISHYLSHPSQVTSATRASPFSSQQVQANRFVRQRYGFTMLNQRGHTIYHQHFHEGRGVKDSHKRKGSFELLQAKSAHCIRILRRKKKFAQQTAQPG